LPLSVWSGLHILLLPVFPLLTVGLLVPLWGRPRRDLAGAATVVAWVGCFVFAAYYTGLDAVAGIAAGTAADHGATGAVHPLFATGDALGYAGAYALAVAALATCAALFPRHGMRVLPGAVVLFAACWPGRLRMRLPADFLRTADGRAREVPRAGVGP
jgi:hypothetical protein